MRELLFRRIAPSAPVERPEFYVLSLEQNTERPCAYGVRQTHYEYDRGRTSSTDYAIELHKTLSEAANRYALLRRALMEKGFTESSAADEVIPTLVAVE